MNIDDRLTSGPIHTFWGKFWMPITLQCIIRSPSRLVLGWGFRGRRIERCHFQLDQIQDGGRWLFWKTSNDHISERQYL